MCPPSAHIRPPPERHTTTWGTHHTGGDTPDIRGDTPLQPVGVIRRHVAKTQHAPQTAGTNTRPGDAFRRPTWLAGTHHIQPGRSNIQDPADLPTMPDKKCINLSTSSHSILLSVNSELPPHAPSTPRGPPLSPRKSHRTHNYSCNLPQAKAPRADQLAIPTVAEQLLHALPCCCKCRPSSPRSHSRRPKQQQTQLHQQPNSRRAGARFYRPENQPQRCSNCCPTKTESGTSG